MNSVPTVKLNSGYEMPLVGFGLWKVNNDTCADQVYNAIKTGYRLLDGACGGFRVSVVFFKTKNLWRFKVVRHCYCLFESDSHI